MVTPAQIFWLGITLQSASTVALLLGKKYLQISVGCSQSEQPSPAPFGMAGNEVSFALQSAVRKTPVFLLTIKLLFNPPTSTHNRQNLRVNLASDLLGVPSANCGASCSFRIHHPFDQFFTCKTQTDMERSTYRLWIISFNFCMRMRRQRCERRTCLRGRECVLPKGKLAK